jgi:hypothetical protein
MDALLEFLYVFVQVFICWRLSLSVGASIVAALVLSSIIEWFTAGFCLTLVLLSTGFGFIWQGRANAGVGLTDPVPPIRISRAVVGLGLGLIGFFWGGNVFYLTSSEIVGALALVASVVLIGVWYRLVLHREVSRSYLVFATASLVMGFSVLLWLKPFYA